MSGITQANKKVHVGGSILHYIRYGGMTNIEDFNMRICGHMLDNRMSKQCIISKMSLLLSVCIAICTQRYIPVLSQDGFEMMLLYKLKSEPNMFKILPIIPSRTSQKIYPLFFLYSHIIVYYSHFILNALLFQVLIF